MSTNLFARLQALLPPSPVLIARVVEVNDDDTSTVELPQGLGNTTISPGVSVGTRLRVRGTSVPVDGNAFIRAGVIESRAPDGEAAEAVVGQVAALPFGPPRLSASATPVPAIVAAVGVALTSDLSTYWLDGYSPRVYSVAAGTLPAGLTFGVVAPGVLAGTATAAAAPRAITLRCVDSTGRPIDLAPFNVSAA